MSFDKDAYNDGDTLYEECGVVGIYGTGEAASLTAFGLHALQHRGQEATGIVSLDGREFHVHKAPEMVGKAFADPGVIAMLKGKIAIGHNRYATAGDGSDRNIQPLYADLSFGGFAIAHNGNLTNAGTLRRELVIKGSLFQCTSDTEVIVHLMAVSAKETPVEKLIDALSKVKGAYSIVACTEGKLIGVRDPHGIRPLVLGRLGDAHVLASESCALDIIGAEFVRDIEPGELVVLDAEGVHSKRPFAAANPRFCIFEYIYFARPDSFMEGHSVYETRKAIGIQLAREAPCPGAEMIVPVPDSGVPAAIGFARESGVPFELGIIRSHYIGRTFIQPGDSIRHLGVRMKHNANRALIDGKKIVLVDDSIVRGTTSRKIVDMMRQAGAAEVHMRISAPPTAHPCFYGIDTPMAEDLIAHNMSTEEIAKLIGVDSLAYISVDGLYKAMGEAKRNNETPQYCDACFTGDYAIELTDQNNQSLSKKVTSLQEHKARK
jgi:amidophosphoribosyltransferase